IERPHLLDVHLFDATFSDDPCPNVLRILVYHPSFCKNHVWLVVVSWSRATWNLSEAPSPKHSLSLGTWIMTTVQPDAHEPRISTSSPLSASALKRRQCAQYSPPGSS